MRTLVTGGTGTVGTALVRTLVERGGQVRVLTRSAGGPTAALPGAEYFAGDLARPASLHAALDGVDAMYLLTPLDPRETSLGLAAIAAAKEARLEHLVFHSIHNVERAPHIPHFRSKIEIIEGLKEAGIRYTLISPNNFFQNDRMFREPLMQYGVYPQPFGHIGVSRVDVRDIADAAANVLDGTAAAGKEYALVGPDVLTAEETASIWSRHLDREVRYGGNDLEAWAEQAKAMMPDWLVDDLCVMFAFFQENGLAASPEDLESVRGVLGHTPRSFDAYAAETARSWRT
jgi:uncharacterized protein YbjT (DUF2867 family)